MPFALVLAIWSPTGLSYQHTSNGKMDAKNRWEFWSQVRISNASHKIPDHKERWSFLYRRYWATAARSPPVRDAEMHWSPRLPSVRMALSGQPAGDGSRVQEIAGWAAKGKRWKDLLTLGGKTSPKLLAARPAGGGLGLQIDIVPLGGQRHIFSGIAHHLFNEDSTTQIKKK